MLDLVEKEEEKKDGRCCPEAEVASPRTHEYGLLADYCPLPARNVRYARVRGREGLRISNRGPTKEQQRQRDRGSSSRQEQQRRASSHQAAQRAGKTNVPGASLSLEAPPVLVPSGR